MTTCILRVKLSIILKKGLDKSLIEWKLVNSRIIKFRLRGRLNNLSIIQCYALTNNLFDELFFFVCILRVGPKTILRAATHETELGDHDFCLSRSHYTDTDLTRRFAEQLQAELEEIPRS